MTRKTHGFLFHTVFMIAILLDIYIYKYLNQQSLLILMTVYFVSVFIKTEFDYIEEDNLNRLQKSTDEIQRVVQSIKNNIDKKDI